MFAIVKAGSPKPPTYCDYKASCTGLRNGKSRRIGHLEEPLSTRQRVTFPPTYVHAVYVIRVKPMILAWMSTSCLTTIPHPQVT